MAAKLSGDAAVAYIKLQEGTPRFDFNSLPVDTNDSLWNPIEASYGLTLPELSAVNNARCHSERESNVKITLIRPNSKPEEIASHDESLIHGNTVIDVRLLLLFYFFELINNCTVFKVFDFISSAIIIGLVSKLQC
jgi:hypothetical protein